MGWLEIARQRHAAYQRALVSSLPSYSIPIGDSDYTAPGYLFYGQFFSCVPDPLYPWDPTVLRAIREFCPDAMPLVIRSVWRNGDYGQMDEPFVLVRHGLGRAIRNPILDVHHFDCGMPATAIPGLCIPGRNLSDCKPNYIEVDWFDKENRQFGHDLPGAYLPFDWEFYYALRSGYEDGSRDNGNLYEKLAAPSRALKARRQRFRQDEGAYIEKDISSYYSVEPSDVEAKEQILSMPEPTASTTEGVSAS